MFTMQAFHDWLALPAEGQDAYKRILARLTLVTRGQVQNLAGELTWYVWTAPQA